MSGRSKVRFPVQPNFSPGGVAEISALARPQNYYISCTSGLCELLGYKFWLLLILSVSRVGNLWQVYV